jgi:hypothetical protein
VFTTPPSVPVQSQLNPVHTLQSDHRPSFDHHNRPKYLVKSTHFEAPHCVNVCCFLPHLIRRSQNCLMNYNNFKEVKCSAPASSCSTASSSTPILRSNFIDFGLHVGHSSCGYGLAFHAVAWVQSQSSHNGLCGEQIGTGAALIQSTVLHIMTLSYTRGFPFDPAPHCTQAK